LTQDEAVARIRANEHKRGGMTKSWQRVLFWLSVLAFFLLALHLLEGILLPFVAGCAIAYFLNPLVDRLESWRVPRGIAALVMLGGFLAAVFLVLLVLVPLLEAQIVELIHRMPHLVAAAQHWGTGLIRNFQARLSPEDFARVSEAVNARLGDIFSWLANLLQNLFQTALTSSVALVSVMSLVFVTPVVAFFLLRDWNKMVGHIESWIPRPYLATVQEQAHLVDETLAGFIRGQASVCALMAVYYASALSLAGLDFGLVLGLFVGILIAIPYLGSATGAAIALILAFAQYDSWLPIALIAGIFALGQSIEGNLVTPKLVGDRIHLHPVWVIFSLLAFGTLFGLIGLLVAVPAAAIIGVLVRFVLKRYLASPFYDPAASLARRDRPALPLSAGAPSCEHASREQAIRERAECDPSE
jgi:predicted PurR-regulated permease PerM